mgnify:CR=1 FL=1
MGEVMYNRAIEVLNIFSNHGYDAYIVGGYPRDSLLKIKTTDIDICTNAKPKEIIDIFDTDGVADVKYGSIKIIYKGYKYDVTTFRKDIKYENNRKPIKIKYVSDLKKDLLRRDFTINTMCIDKDGNLIDLLNAKTDLDNHVIKTVGNPRYRLKEDSLRILRAIRFASILDFDIDDKTKYYIKKYGYLLKKLSNARKREELDKILTSKNKEKGRKLLIELEIDKQLQIDNLNDIVLCNDIIGVWSQIDMQTEYPFSKIEMDTIKKIKELSKLEINKINIYKYGLYISTVVGSIKGISNKKINDIYNSLPITSKKDIAINGKDIAGILNQKPGEYISDIISLIEKKIILGELDNDYDQLLKYVKENY